MASHFLGIDVGTSGTKAIVVSDDGTVLGTGTGAHEPRVPHGGWSEQPVEDWWRSVVVAIEGACAAAGPSRSGTPFGSTM